MKKLIPVIMSFVFMMLVAVGVHAEDVIEISSTKVTMNVGDTVDLDITGTDKVPVWYSYNNNIARVNSKGEVYATKVGKTTIRARVGYTYKNCVVTVVNSSIKLNRPQATIYCDGTSVNKVQIKAVLKGATRNVQWKSLDPTVATVDEAGVVTSVAPGKAIIEATANNCSAYSKVTVLRSAITLNNSSIFISTKGLGSSIKLVPTVTGSSKRVVWSTSDKTVATVSAAGVVTGRGTGNATITATANGVSTTCSVKVIAGNVSINEEQILLYSDNPVQDTKILKTNAGRKDVVKWMSTDESVATVDSLGKVSAVGAGEALILAELNGSQDSCKVTVKQTSTSIGEDTVSLKTKGTNNTYVLDSTVVGKTARKVWRTDNARVVTVANGKLIARGAGTANVTLTANGKTDTVAVVVENYDPTIKLNAERYTLYTEKGNILSLKAVVDGPVKTVTWTSSDETIATVNGGRVTALKEGNVQISATANGVTATCDIEVLKSEVVLTSEKVTIDKGEKYTLGYDITGLSQVVTWRTDNANVAVVNKLGVITARAYGKATITAIANGVTSTCQISVQKCEHSYISTTIEEATCGENGISKTECVKCGDSYTEIIPATKLHTFEIVDAILATCLGNGEKILECSVCGEINIEELPLGDHIWSEWVDEKASTYTETGLRSRSCYACGQKDSEEIAVIAHDHIYHWVTDKEPTCTEVGEQSYVCSLCNDIKETSEIKVLSHAYGDWVTIEEPKEGKTGSAERYCSVCGAVDSKVLPAIVKHIHDYNQSNEVLPTCTKGGYTVFSCPCGDEYNANLKEALGHTWYDWTIESKTINGETTVKEMRLCDRCRITEEREHNHSYFVLELVEPTCVSEGYKVNECSCGSKYYSDQKSALGHKWSDWKYVESTLDTTNVKEERKCDGCNETEERDHTHCYSVKEVVEPTNTERGYTLYICECGGEYKDNYVDTIAHSWSEWAIVEATLNTDEIKDQRECSDCHEVEQRDHVHKFELFETVAPTCTSEGIGNNTCQACGHKENASIPALGHDLRTTTVKYATCLETGVERETCYRCDYTNDTETSLGNHNYLGSYVVTKEATCTEKGTRTKFCKLCNEALSTISVSKTPHKLEWVVTKEPTYSENGLKENKCSVCGYVSETEIIPNLGGVCTHSSYTWEVSREANCVETELKTAYCNECHEIINENVDTGKLNSKNHKNLVTEVTEEPTYTLYGAKVSTCDACGYSHTELIPKLICPHDGSTSIVSSGGKWWKKCNDCKKLLYEVDLTQENCPHTKGATKTCKQYIGENIDGIWEYTCNTCGKIVETGIIKGYQTYIVDLGNGETTEIYGYFNEELSYKIFEKTNEYRVSLGLEPLNYATNLQGVCNIRGYESAYSFSHTRPNGTKWYTLNNSKMNAENLALGFYDADDVMRAWKASEGHNANLVWTKAKSLAVSAFIRYIGVDSETQSIPGYRYVQAQTFSCYANP